MLNPADFARARQRMVETQIERRGVRDAAVLAAMRAVPREAFVEPGSEDASYDDAPQPIGEGQSISQPFIVAAMIEAAAVRPGERILEVGAGSGYAAAVIGRIAGRVYAIERHAALATRARRRLKALGCDTIEIRAGDGTQGWPEAAPFDAIIVSAGGPRVPEALKRQLAIGGRLVMPVGAGETSQRLVKVTRLSEADYVSEDRGGVHFVPLIGAEGWPDDGLRRPSLADLVAGAAEPLPEIDDPAFAAVFDRFADRQLLLLGEATHGTAEFYRVRAAVTRRLVERHGFGIVAVEADWPDAAAIDRHVRQRPPRPGPPPFRRFPAWMWRNAEVEAFVDDLRRHNATLAPERRAGFYGLDIYNLSGSIAAVIAYLDRVDPAAAAVARRRYGCLEPWQRHPAGYGRAVLGDVERSCEAAVVAQCRELLGRGLADAAAEDGDGLFDAAQNAQLVAAAEHYYRAMYHGDAETWNLRDRAMFDTLARLMEARGPGAKAVVWAHNSHIGDARFTDMGTRRGELNLGQLCRERFGDGAVLIGFGTHEGSVAAASDWDAPMQVMRVRPAAADSFEALCHDAGSARCLIDFGRAAELAGRLARPLPQRFIGVVYRPESERASHYQDAAPARQFDAYVWFDETTAVTPLGPQPPAGADAAETYPFGV
jgi:protein-L-isoaspartate(D-aspartate) O-methyltransferase